MPARTEWIEHWVYEVGGAGHVRKPRDRPQRTLEEGEVDGGGHRLVAGVVGMQVVAGVVGGIEGVAHRLGQVDDGAVLSRELRACTGLIGLVAAAWPTASALQPDDRKHDWADFDPGLVAHVREDFPDLPPAALALTLRVWGRMHGLMALEIYGHLRTLIHDPAAVYRDEMRDLIASLGLTS